MYTSILDYKVIFFELSLHVYIFVNPLSQSLQPNISSSLSNYC